MSNMLEDIQYVGSDTRPPMLNRTDYESLQQRIRLYCLGKGNAKNIMKSIVEGPFQMGTKTETLAGGVEDALQLGPELDIVFSDLTQEEKDRYKANIRATNILLQGLQKDMYALINHYTDAKDILDNVKMLLKGSELTKDDRESQLYDDFEHFRQNKGENIHSYYVRFTKLINDMRHIKMTMQKMQLNSKFVINMLPKWSRFITEVTLNRGLRESNFDQLYAYLKQHEVTNFDDDVDDPPEQDLALIVDLIFEAEQCDAFDSDVDEAPTTQTMFMVNLSSKDPLYDEARPSYDMDIPYEVHDHDNCSDGVYERHDEHKMQNNVQQDYVAKSNANYTSDINIILYDQYVEDSVEQVVHSNVSSVQNDALNMIINDMHEHGVQSMSANKHNKVVNDTLTSELARYKELVELKGKMKIITVDPVKPKVLAPGMYDIDVEPIPPLLKNNRDTHFDYLKHLKESVETVREIIEESRLEKPIDNVLASPCSYTKHSQELLEYVIGTCPKESIKRNNKAAITPLTRIKQVTFNNTCGTSTNNTQKHVVQQKVHQSNVSVIPSIGVSSSTEASRSKPRSNTNKNKILPARSENKV
nr:retrovirus-related Pol polyprotein from transposon TNT 1-94 [Tanacetum cinerariifolium]GEY72666.1 retrovirus-related Pol polyprotein from transposon TNT 1-94 [Tanacetum cinerariifolium]